MLKPIVPAFIKSFKRRLWAVWVSCTLYSLVKLVIMNVQYTCSSKVKFEGRVVPLICQPSEQDRYVYIRTCIRTCTCTCAYMYVYTCCKHVCLYVHVHVCLCVCVFVQEFNESVADLKPKITEVQTAGKTLKDTCSTEVC